MVEPVESRVVANGLEHHVVTWDGGGDPVVLCHGFLDLAWSWNAVGRRLAAEGFRAMAFDWRGHGETQHVGAGGYYHFPDYVLDLTLLLPQLSEAPVHLVGHSMGGSACTYFAGTFPDGLRTLTLIEGIGIPPMASAAAPDRAQAFVAGVKRIRDGSARVMKDLHEVLRRMRVQNPDLDEELGLFLAEKGTREVDGGRVWSFDPLHRTTSPARFDLPAFHAFLDRIEVPTLFVGGSEGMRLPDESDRVARIRDSERVEIEGASHMMHWHTPDALADVVIGFLQRHGA